jgi:glucose/mannose transport system substrate-binding protein
MIPRMKKLFCSPLAGVALLLSVQMQAASFAADKKLEIFSYWTSGGEAAALDALFQATRRADPGIEIINSAVAGGGNTAQPVLQARLSGGNPPDSWQVHPGWELFGGYVQANYCEPITDLYNSEGWDKVVPKDLIDMLTKNGQTYAVLVGVHRGNDLWYNKKVLEKNGIKVGDKMTFAEFFADAEKLKAAGVTPLAVGDSGIWATAQLFENTLLGTVGPQGWTDLFTGKMAWDHPKVKRAAEIYGKMLAYQNADHSALTWYQAVKAVMEGKCAFTSMGDWAYGEFAKAKMKDNEDFGWVSHPGTDGGFIIVADGFTLAKGAPHRQEAITWLKVCGSRDAQEAFNPLKGSIPSRTDIDKNKFGPYHNWSMNSFARDKLLPSCVHGAAAPDGFRQAFYGAVSTFVVDKNADRLVKALAQAAKEAEMAK